MQGGCEFASTQATRHEYRGRGNYAPSGLFCIDHFVPFWTSVSLYSSPSRWLAVLPFPTTSSICLICGYVSEEQPTPGSRILSLTQLLQAKTSCTYDGLWWTYDGLWWTYDGLWQKLSGTQTDRQRGTFSSDCQWSACIVSFEIYIFRRYEYTVPPNPRDSPEFSTWFPSPPPSLRQYLSED